MSSKRYEFKVLESSDPADLEQQLNGAGAEGWGAVGYGVLPNGHRSALVQRKGHDGHGHGDRHRRRFTEDDRSVDEADSGSGE